MDVSSASLSSVQNLTVLLKDNPGILGKTEQARPKRDTVTLGAGQITASESINVVLERALSKLQSVVSDARAELGLSEDAEIDTSPEATATRIADFALNFFESFRANHEELGDEEAKQAFVDLILPAIEEGISEARGILEALSALDPDTDASIDTIYDAVLNRIDEFLGNTGE